MNTTVRIKASQIYKDWHVIDAAGRPLGRVATEVAHLLRGKHKPTFEPHLDDGDFVIVVNASKVRLSGNKPAQKVYYRHSGYPGGLSARSFTEQLQRFPERVIERAVWGMLPKGPLGKQMLRHLKVYAGPTHPHQAQVIASQRAQAQRQAALEALATTPYRPKGLRPLSAPVVASPAAPSAEAAEVARRARARVLKQEAEAAEPTAEEQNAMAAAAAGAEAAASEAPAAEKRPRRRATAPAEAAAADTAAEADKPSRRRRTRAESTSESSEE